MKEKIFIAAAALLCVACSKKATESKVSPVEVKVQQVQTGSETMGRTYVGTVKESYGSALSFSTMGTVRTVSAQVGQAVKQGQALATLDDSQARNAFEIANASLKQAEDGYKRMKQLYDKGSLPEVKFVDIQTKLAEAQTSVKMAKKNITDCVLTAPFSGYISEKSIDVGNNVVPGMACFKLVKLGSVEVTFPVPEQEIAQMKVGQEVAFTVSALNDRRYAAKITKKGVQASALSHTYEVTLTVANGDQALLPGMVCSVETHVKDANAGNTIVIPQEAVLTDGKEQFVWVAQGNKAMRRKVEVVGIAANGVIVASGIAAGDDIIVSGQNKVSEGMSVKTIK